MVALNLLAPFFTAQAAYRVMREQPDGGSVINIGSVSAHSPQPGTAAYSAAKAGLLGLTRALALEWAPRVRVNHITVGLVRTENAAALYGDDDGAAVAGIVPLGWRNRTTWHAPASGWPTATPRTSTAPISPCTAAAKSRPGTWSAGTVYSHLDY